MNDKQRRWNVDTLLARKTLRPCEVAEVYGVSLGTLANLRSRRLGPKFFKQGKSVFYRVEDFESWLMRNPVLTRDCTGD
ncbi:MAG: helix-turn-helix domain-containing protein [Syntrophorhabdales bacterium]|jgi:hypothetical protein